MNIVLEFCIIKKELHKNKVNLINDLHFINIKKLYLSVKHFPNTYSLQDSLKKEKIKFSGTQHRAYDDAYNTGKVLAKMLEKGWTYEAYKQAKEEAAQR